MLDLLADLSACWETIGIALRVDDNALDTLSRSSDSDTIKLNNVIRTWKSTKSSPDTWETLISAIEGRIVNKKAKADEIRAYLAGLSH